MKTLNDKFIFLIVLFITVSLVFSCSKLKELSKEENKKEETKKEDTKSTKKENTAEGKLYFCEDYKNGEEIGVSNRFSTGWLTVMIDLRPAGKTLGVGKVELRLTRIKDADGNKLSEKIIDTVPFEVQADWEYTYFKDTDRIRFKIPGTYKVTCQKVDGTPIVSGEVAVTAK